MKVVTVREFARWRSFTEPVRIENRGKAVGTFYPAGMAVDELAADRRAAELAVAERRVATGKRLSVHEVLEKANGKRAARTARRG